MPDPTLYYVSCPDAKGGHRMAYWQWGERDAAHAIVCVHGLSRQGRDFDVLARALVQRSQGAVRVVCPDVVGRGRSDWLKDPMGYQLPTYVADMLALIAQLQGEAPIATLDWVGTSMGGLIGMALAGTPKLPLSVPIRRLVLNDVGPAVEWASVQRIQGYLGQTGRYGSLEEAAEAMWRISTGFGPHTPAQWLALSRPMVKPLPDGALTLHYDPAIAEPVRQATEEATAQATAVLWQAWDRITARVLVLRGAESDLLARETALAMTQRGPRASLVEFPGVGHAPTLVPDAQVAAVATFLVDPADEKPGRGAH